jgi:uncharacterized protein YjiS (DUF1127 family)
MAAWTNAHTGPRLGAAPDLRRRLAQWRGAWERYRIYRTTLGELSQLSQRELDDIGIARANIHEVAWSAAVAERDG